MMNLLLATSSTLFVCSFAFKVPHFGIGHHKAKVELKSIPKGAHIPLFSRYTSLMSQLKPLTLTDKYIGPIGVRPSINCEMDYLGMINFCLQPTDTALSGPSRSKLLNEITNDVFKAIMLDYQPLVDSTLKKFEFYREQIEFVECPLEDPSVMWSSKESVESKKPDYKCAQDLMIGRLYVDKLEKLLDKGAVMENSFGDSVYDTGYVRLITYLSEAGCTFVPLPNEETVDPKMPGMRPIPPDANICLSMLDLRDPKGGRTKTRVLNHISNCVSRAILYGGKHSALTPNNSNTQLRCP
jgi:hypothetical protein